MTQAYDYQLGSMKFLSAASAETPYRRSSGEIRSQQIDTSANPGEQSLNSWWLRSQPSFHYGEGYTFNEPTDDEEVQGGCHASYGVDLTKPGRVTLLTDASVNAQSTARPCYEARSVVATSADFWHLSQHPTSLNQALYKTNTVWQDADIMDWTWNGTNFFTTTQTQVYRGTTSSAGSAVQIYAIAGGNYTLLRHVKNRLILAKGDDGGSPTGHNLYELNPNITAGANALPTPFATVEGLVLYRGIEEGPNAIYVGGYITADDAQLSQPFLWKFVLSASGSLPTLSQPINVYQFGTGEGVQAFHVNGDKMILNTGKGIRVGEIQENGDVLFGPYSIKSTVLAAGSGAIASNGDHVYIGINGTAATQAKLDDGWVYGPSSADSTVSTAGVLLLDLSRRKRDGTYAWQHWYSIGTTGTVRTVGVNGDDCVIGTSTRLYRTHASYNKVASGWLRTGWIRFNTLEDKFFKYATIRNRSQGSIGVSTIAYANDTATATTTTSVGTAASGSVSHIDLARTTPEERIKLKFVLNRHGSTLTTGAELEGYQVRALPAPTKHRIIRIPILLFPEMRDHKGQRVPPLNVVSTLSTLETLEDDGTIITFQHLDNGQVDATRQVSVVIESVDYIETTPPANARGEGGVAYITLRTVAA